MDFITLIVFGVIAVMFIVGIKPKAKRDAIKKQREEDYKKRQEQEQLKNRKFAHKKFAQEGSASFKSSSESGVVFDLILEKDGFTNDNIVKFADVGITPWGKIMSYCVGENCVDFYIGFRYEKQKYFMAISAYQDNIKFKKGDKLLLLLANKNIMEYEISENGYRIGKDSEGILAETKMIIKNEDIELFSNEKIIKWRYIDNKTNVEKTGDVDFRAQTRLKSMAEVCIGIVDEFVNNEKND